MSRVDISVEQEGSKPCPTWVPVGAKQPLHFFVVPRKDLTAPNMINRLFLLIGIFSEIQRPHLVLPSVSS